MKNYKELLNHITTFIFDVDGVLTDGGVLMLPGHQPLRRFSSRDGYAIQLAIKKGFRIAIITGGRSEAVKERLGQLGVKDVFLAVGDKKEVLSTYMIDHQLKTEEVLYMGDDLPDYEVMQMAGVACSPADAVPEIKAISNYVSVKNGGMGCARDIIEQTLKVQQNWMKKGDGIW